MATSHPDNTVIESLCAVKSELPPSAELPCERGDIARRAYEIYESRGRIDGFAVDDWLEAERELTMKGAQPSAG